MTGQTMIVRGLVILLGFLLTSSASAQAPQHFPLDHRVEPGVLSHWHSIAEPGLYGAPQLVSVSVPGEGEVTFPAGASLDGVTHPAPARATLLVGHVYRFKISVRPELPGGGLYPTKIDLYPTIELVSRLHPPADLVDEFPVPIDITTEEILSVLQDRMVTKIVYLERPDLAAPVRQEEGPHVTELGPAENLIETATNLGRPVAIVRMGGRIPLSNSPEAWPSTTAPIQFPALPRE